ncbi:MAG: hypothetical protein PHG36_06115 [Dehalococcoidia bacterium]|nr:hypothetical protein [Dehalococcoidia bacterium]
MDEQKKPGLRDRIIKEMTIDHLNALEKNFDLAKRFIRITKEGNVDILIRDKLNGKESIILYLVGKLYAKEAGFTEMESVANRELMEELGISEGSLLPWLKDLRDDNKIKQIKRERYTYHYVPINLVEKYLKTIEAKLNKSN